MANLCDKHKPRLLVLSNKVRRPLFLITLIKTSLLSHFNMNKYYSVSLVNVR